MGLSHNTGFNLYPFFKALYKPTLFRGWSFSSEDMLSTIFYISKDKEKVLLFFETIIDKWSVVPYGKELISEAIIECKMTKGQDLEDTLQCLCAKKHNCTYIVTSDKGFIDCGVEVISYDDML